MPTGDKGTYTEKQKRQAHHIEEGYEERGTPEKEAKQRAWATVNQETGGGKKSGSGRGKTVSTSSARKGGAKGSASQSTAKRSAAGRKAAATRTRSAAGQAALASSELYSPEATLGTPCAKSIDGGRCFKSSKGSDSGCACSNSGACSCRSSLAHSPFAFPRFPRYRGFGWY